MAKYEHRMDINSLKSTSINGVKVYSIARHRSLPPWVPPNKQKALRKDKHYRERIDLIQDLWFETATTKIKATPDGEYVIASGIYPPQVKVYTVKELAQKFERHLISEIINFQVLDDDYSKMAFLCADRSVFLHAKYGSHYSLRIPRMGRDLTYDCWSCDLLCAASSPEIYRINLQQGRFLTPLNSHSPAINVVSRSSVHGLVASGGEDGAVECYDLRSKSSVGRINAVTLEGDADKEVTALQFDDGGGFTMAVGSSAGKIMIYDLRSSRPVRVKDHMYGSPIIDVKWHQTPNSTRPKLISTDKHIVRIWDPEMGENFTSIEPNGEAINDVCVFPNTGLILLAQDCSRIASYFIPALGPAPKWCTHLDSMTEELEEEPQTTIYENYKFVTKEDLEQLNLNLNELIEQSLLKAEMHGFYIKYDLYKKARALAEPFAYDAYIEKKKQEKLEAERASRITIKKRRLPRVNKDLAYRLLENEEEDEMMNDDTSTKKKASKKNKGLTSELLTDNRFADMFENKDFEVDKLSSEYLSLHPQASKKQTSLVDEHFDLVSDDEEQTSDGSDASASVSEDEFDEGKYRTKTKTKVPRLYEVKDERHAEAFREGISLADEDALPLGDRVSALQDQRKSGVPSGVKFGPGGSREISFISRSFKKQHKDDFPEEPRAGKRRGIQPLGLKPDRSGFRGGRGGRRGHRGRGRR